MPSAPKRIQSRNHDSQRGTACARGYDRKWRSAAVLYRLDHPVCEDCKRALATDVHHPIKVADRPDLKLDPNNMMALCHECHAKRTAKGE